MGDCQQQLLPLGLLHLHQLLRDSKPYQVQLLQLLHHQQVVPWQRMCISNSGSRMLQAYFQCSCKAQQQLRYQCSSPGPLE
jgi:hypothetical protein